VFSISTRDVVAKPGDEDMLVEEYGERAFEARRKPPYGIGNLHAGRRSAAPGPGNPLTQLDVSEDEIADGEPPPDSAS
jgi:hypothetical protein